MRGLWLALLWGCGGPQRAELPDPAVLLFRRLDADGSGFLELSELPANKPERSMDLLDQDRDGRLSLAELRADLDADLQP